MKLRMKMANSFKHSIVCLAYMALVLVGFTSKTYAVNVPVAPGRIETTYPGGTAPGINASTFVDISPKPIVGAAFTDVSVINTVEFGYDANYPLVVAATNNFTIELEIKTYDATNTLSSTTNRTFSIYYDPNSTAVVKDKDVYKVPMNAWRVEARLTKINGVAAGTLPKNMYVELRMYVDRVYDFASVVNTGPTFSTINLISIDGVAGNDEIEVNWNALTGTDEYQLEWTFVNDYNITLGGTPIGTGALPYDFRNNSTRISTTATSYKIPLLFDRGWVVFRLRAIGRDKLNTTNYLFSVWSNSTPDNGFVSGATSKIQITGSHESNKNWQVTTTFAEEGKKKEVVSYFDGSLRNRQTITRINSDNNVIVGETFYDYQGRPGVTTLPTPVSKTAGTQASLHYYHHYNKANAGGTPVYDREYFDKDVSNACDVGATGMSTTSGSSNYYSASNPYKTDEQAFVPDANLYPFAQIEYTPDNTGRVRRQGGVGPEFQLDSGHETKYYYSQPNQMQLDRLFGSEVGDATHYKKNVVIDPNGQVSVSYLDQEGRVIATALAGDAPASLDALSSAGGTGTNFKVDFFAKNPALTGTSLLNTPNPAGNSINFSTQLNVPYAANYTFSYDMTVPAFTDSCLLSAFCFNCIYNLSIKIIDECGTTIWQPSNNAMVGNFTVNGDGSITFSTACTGATGYTMGSPYTNPVALGVGTYTVIKTLTVNEDAVNFYANTYLNLDYNSCFKTLEDFQAEYLANVDTLSCYQDCATCLSNLGDRDAFVLNGLGTALEYDFLYEECTKDCKKMFSACEAAYDMMLSDVTPGGQYAQYMDATGAINVGAFPLSVLNQANLLPVNMTASYVTIGSSSTVYWKTPQTTLNGTTYNYYVNNDGTRGRVDVFNVGGVYTPAFSGSPLVDQVTGQEYVYPENLTSVAEFITAYASHPEWAKGLVYMHPEYCYYQKCKEYGKKQGSDTYTSDDYDYAMMATGTYAAAVSGTGGFPNSIPGTFINSGTGLPNNPSSGSFMYDPFVYSANSGVFGAGANTKFMNKWNNYMPNPAGGWFNMYQAAAIATRCGTSYGVAIAGTCDDFGTGSTALKDEEWKIYKGYYAALKSQVQQELADEYAQSCNGINDCIGNADDFNPITSGMFTYTPGNYFNTSLYWYSKQPCSHFVKGYYASKQSRFPDEQLIPGVSATTSPQSANYQTYIQTGQCPKAFAIEDVMSEIAAANKLLAASEPLINYDSYYTFYLVDNNYAPTSAITTNPLSWKIISSTTNNIRVKWEDPTPAVKLNLELDKTGAGIANWSDIIAFTNLQSSAYAGTYTYGFSVTAKVHIVPSLPAQPYDTCIQINGSTSYNIATCVFPEVCSANQFALDIQTLMSALAGTTQLTATAYTISPTYDIAVSAGVRTLLGYPSGNLQWNYNVGTTTWTLKPASAALPKLDFKILSTQPTGYTSTASLNNIKGFTAIVSAYQNYFTFEGRDAAGALLVTIKAQANLTNASGVSSPVEMGTCGLPTPLECQTNNHLVTTDLYNVLREALLTSPFVSNINLFTMPSATPLLKGMFPGATSTSSVYTKDVTPGVYDDILAFTITGGNLTLTTSSTNSSVHIDNVRSLGPMQVTGAPGVDNYYHSFLIPAVFGGGATGDILGTTSLPLAACECTSEEEEEFMMMEESSSSENEEEEVPVEDTIIIDYAVELPGDSASMMSQSVMVGQLGGLDGDTCEFAYSYWNTAVSQYNTWQSTHPTYPTASTSYSASDFTADEYCYCVTGYIAFLKSIVNGGYSSTYANNHIEWFDIGLYCNGRLTPPCTPETNAFNGCEPDITLPSIPYSNPCADQLIQNAMYNAQVAYNQYISSQTTYIAAAYRNHCMKAVENFTYQYADKEYHFTLYYYDQAGNLIKTIPPAGVTPLSFDTDLDGVHTFNDPAAVKVQQDRLNHTHLVYTNHLLATTYEYNSLNQLVKQNMPDHDAMNVFETTLPGGLEMGLTITKIQYLDGAKGYLTGFTTANRGILYTTNDAGQTWQRVNDVLAAHINKIHMVDASNGFAVANDGIVLKTVNGGSTWEMLQTYANNINWNLNDLVFINTNTGILVGTSDGTAKSIKITSASTSPVFATTNIPNSSFTAGGYFIATSITHDGTRYVIAARHKASASAAERGRIYASNDGSSWTEHVIFRAADLNKVDQYSSTNCIITGDVGLLQDWNISGTPAHTDGECGSASTIKDHYFINRNDGIALMDEAGVTGIYSTNNGGVTWTLKSAIGESFNRIELYNSVTVGPTTTVKLTAVGANGLVKRVIQSTGLAASVIPIVTPLSSATLKASWAEVAGTATPALAAGNGPVAYYTSNIGTVNWSAVTVTPTIPSGQNIKRIAGLAFGSGSSLIISTVMLTESGTMYGVFKNSSNVFSVAAITLAGVVISDITYQNSYVLAYDNTNDRVYRITLNNTAASSSATLLTNAGSALGTPDITSIDASGTSFVAVGKMGVVLRGVLNSSATPTTVTWTLGTDNQVPLGFTDVRYLTGVNKIYATAVNGNVYVNTTNTWQQMETPCKDDINAIAANSTGTNGMLVANAGKAYAYSITGNVLTLTPKTTSTTVNLNDVVINDTSAYIAGDQGTLLGMSDYNALSFTAPVAAIGNQKLTGIILRPTTSEYLAVGANAHLRKFVPGNTAIKVNQVYVPALNAVHFINANEGYVVGDLYTVRHTTDAGQTWTVLKEGGTWSFSGATLPNFRGVAMHNTNKATIVGTQGRIMEAVGNTIAINTTLTGGDFYDVAFNDKDKGYIVGCTTATNQQRLYYTANADALTPTWSQVTYVNATTGILKAVHVFKRNNFYFAVGTNGAVRYGDNTAAGSIPTAIPSSGSFVYNDVHFTDDVTGYIVGDANLVYKFSGVLNGSGNYLSNTWTGLAYNDGLLNQNTTNGTFNIKAIALNSYTNGTMGGWFSDLAAAPVVQLGYARNFKDESLLYSTNFYYDRLGRIVVSQNTRQYTASPKLYSYTLYDALGRVLEAGEKAENVSTLFSSVFGTNVNGFYNPTTIDDAKLLTWINTLPSGANGVRSQVTRTYYDAPNSAIAATLPGGFTQDNMRKRIAAVAYYDTWSTSTATTAYEHATHYSYDIHGNVKTLLQDNKKLATNNTYAGFNVTTEQFKRIDYRYDLISGNVHEVNYQTGSVDQLHHAYIYDSDNRITEVKTSIDKTIWDSDAKYFYYDHGPLARVEIGDDNVQGIDYAYTLQGWIKGTNSNDLDRKRDIGRDGYIATGSGNQYFAQDVAGYSLNYFNADYTPIDATNRWTTVTDRFEASKTSSNIDMAAANANLYNGNIRAMVTSITNPTGNVVMPQATWYSYDQLNRLKEAKAFANLNTTTNVWGSMTYAGRYNNTFSYDANGNIKQQQRKSENGTVIDSLSYKYLHSGNKLVKNRLYHVDDNVALGTFTDDVDDMGSMDYTATYNANNNYSYDAEGRLTKDNQEKITNIIWRVDGKVKEVLRTTASGKKALKFDYDAMGQRIAKHQYNEAGTTWEKSTYYVRDAQGNVLGTYEKTGIASLKVIERDLYGSARIGMNITQAEMVMATAPSTSDFKHEIAVKQFEISNHLGNVLAVITDRKTPIDDGDHDGDNNGYNENHASGGAADNIVDFYKAQIISATDYSPFGVQLDGRNFSSTAYRYGFQGQEKDDEMKGPGNSLNYTYRMHDPRLGRFFAVDPLARKYPYNSTYAFSENRVIDGVELEGLEWMSTTRIWEAGGFTKTTLVHEVKTGIVYAGRIATDIMTIAVGVAVMAGTGGLGTAGVLPFLMGAAGTVGGTTKLAYDVMGDYESADKTPTTLSGTVAVTLVYQVEGREVTKEELVTIEFIEGVVTLDYKKLLKGDLTEFGQVINMTITNMQNLPEPLQQIITSELANQQTKILDGEVQPAATDATTVQPPPPRLPENTKATPEKKVEDAKSSKTDNAKDDSKKKNEKTTPKK